MAKNNNKIERESFSQTSTFIRDPRTGEFLHRPALVPVKSRRVYSKERERFENITFEDYKQIKTDKSIEGTDLGIFLYFVGWFLVGMVFTFTTNETIKHVLDFYISYDIMALGFIAIHFGYNHKRHSDPNYRFLSFKSFDYSDVLRGVGYVGLCFLLLLIANFVIGLCFVLGQVEFINTYNTNTHVILSITRTILTEELVFRGLILICIVIVCREVFKFAEKTTLILSVLISGITFGLIHYFRYVTPDPWTGKVSLSLLQPIFYLMVLGFLCGYLAIKEGLWAACLLHTVNNLVAIYSGGLADFGIVFNLTTVLIIIILISSILIIYVFIVHIPDDLFIFHYFAVSLIGCFIIGFYTNGLVKSEDLGGLYFEHMHAILFIPLVYLIFRNKVKNGKLYSVLMGICLGLFISDYLDIINLNAYQSALTVLYASNFMLIYLFINLYLKKRNSRQIYLNNKG